MNQLEIELAFDLLELARQGGLQIFLRDGKIIVKPSAGLIQADADWIRQHREAIMEALEYEQNEQEAEMVDSVARSAGR